MIFDPSDPNIEYGTFPECDWKEFYGDVKEAIPHDALLPCGKGVELRMFIDSNHADKKVMLCWQTGMLIFLNMAMMDWVSKKQPTVKTSVFGAKFISMKFGIEKAQA